jgi:4-diphosphocytidyl-2-C-methyl-D-erythritol kinase
MAPISVYDSLVVSPDASGAVSVSCRWASPGAPESRLLGELPADTDNLVTKAAQLLRARSGTNRGVRIELVKRIPTSSGLGGGSSDAAAALVACDAVWNLGWSRQRLAELGSELGSDVPFFLAGSAAICRGRGERVEPVSGLGAIDCVVVRPPEGLSTARVYGQCRVSHQPRPIEPLLDALSDGDARSLSRLVYNRLEEAAESLSPWVGRLRDEFAREDCLAARLSGSGTAYFGICRHARHARRVARRLQSRRLGWVQAVSTSN